MGSPILFLILAVIAIAAALLMITSRNAIHAALFLIVNFVTVAVFYLILKAPFVAMVQVTVYAGAIMVLFLFVIMLLGAEKLQGVSSRSTVGRMAIAVLGLALILTFVAALLGAFGPAGIESANIPALDSSPEALGIRLFEGYVFPFEITSVLLLAATIGVVVLRPRKKGEGDTQ
ncbi:MAG: NADH-quinone oxidoreductase subunit J [Chloroflexi bacterium]|nr:NADH-quinone oxidoreductase subunit J [Chloroflexota bacterium]